MAERLIILAVVGGLIALSIVAVRTYNASRVRGLVAAPINPLWASLGVQPDGRRTLITFSTPSCAACHRAQAPAVGQVEQQLGPDVVRVIRINAAERPEVARAFGVMTVPSTVV